MIRLLWASQLRSIGNAYGYSTQGYRMLEALRARGDVEISEDFKEGYDLAVHVITPDQFKPIPGLPNLLFTMYEATEIPPQWVEPINKADVLVVPCRQNQQIFQPHFRHGQVERCRLGVDPLQFPYFRRERSANQPFRFLWVGAPNPRKGFQLALGAWTLWLRSGRMPHDVELYMKSSGTEKDRVVRFKAALQMRNRDEQMPDNPADRARAVMENRAAFDFFDEKDVSPQAPIHPCVLFDTRDYNADQMRQLYHSANAFVLPSVGEGWGLTLCEALSTGAPSIWTHWSGPTEFADDSTGFPIRDWSLGPLQMMSGKKDETGKWVIYKSHDSYGAIAHGPALVKRFEQIYHGYDAALARGRRAADRIHAHFKWSDSAEEFMQIVMKHLSKGKVSGTGEFRPLAYRPAYRPRVVLAELPTSQEDRDTQLESDLVQMELDERVGEVELGNGGNG